MNYKLGPKLFLGGLALALVICFLGLVFGWEYAHFPAIIVMLGSVIVADKFYYCPHCSGKWSFKTVKPTYCPHCGEKIDW